MEERQIQDIKSKSKEIPCVSDNLIDILKYLEGLYKKGDYNHYVVFNNQKIYVVDMDCQSDFLNLTSHDMTKVGTILEDSIDPEEDFTHDREIAQSRYSVRLRRGLENIDPNSQDEWTDFLNYYNFTPCPFNYELESILKYLVYIKENPSRLRNIALKFIEEFKDLSSPTNTFILANVTNFSEYGLTFFKLINQIIQLGVDSKDFFATNIAQINDLIARGVPREEAMIFINARSGCLTIDNQEYAQVIIFDNGNVEGLNNEGSWIYTRNINTHNGHSYRILYEINENNTIRHIINESSNIAISSDDSRPLITCRLLKMEIIPYAKMKINSNNDIIIDITEGIKALNIDHERYESVISDYEELASKAEESSDELMVERIFNQQEITYQKKKN